MATASAPAGTKPRRKKKAVSTTLAVGVVIDRSSSMGGLERSVIDGFNEYIADLRKQEGDTFLTLTVFSDEHEFVYEGRPLNGVPPLTGETYRPFGNTALYDSIAATVERVERGLGETEKDTKVLIVTITDGEENRSKEHTAASLAALVRRYEAKGNYTFVYLGLGQTQAYVASAAVQGLGYIGDNGYFPTKTTAGVSRSFAGLAMGSSSLRASHSMSSVNMMADAGVDVNAGASGVLVPPFAPSTSPSTADATITSNSSYTESSLLDHLTGGQ